MSQTITTGELLELKLSELKPAPDNPRLDVGDVTELAASIKALGILEPILAMRQNGHYLIVAGARRYAGAKKAGLVTVPVIVREFEEKDRISAMLVENLQRNDLTIMEEARALHRLIDDCGMSQRDLAAKVGRSQGHISKRLALIDLLKDALKELDAGGITIEEALELAKIKDPKRQLKVWKMRGQTYGGIARAVRDELELIEREKRVAAETAKLEAAGARVIAFDSKGNHYYPELPAGVIGISKDGSWNDLRIDPGKHKNEPCHAAAVNPRTGEVVLVCTDRTRHPKAKTQREIDAHRYSRRADGGENRELEKARKVRREFAATVVQGKPLTRDIHAELVLDTMIRSAHQEVLKVASRLTAIDVEGTNYGAALRAYAARGLACRQRVEVAIAFATHEEFLGVYYGWESHAAYIELLEAYGYEVSPAERKKLPKAARMAKAA